jgi:Prenyltransferase and squalene oxidase repeat
MGKCFLTALAILFLALPAAAEPRKREAFEAAIDSALDYLAKSQNPDGSWTSGRQFGGGGFNQGGARDPAITGLCVMAFLSAGHVPGEGKYASVIENGVKYVAGSQQANGLFAGNQFGMTTMYSHGICTLMVAEVIGLMPDRRHAATLRRQLENAIKLIRHAQAKAGQNEGGWRYQPQPGDADMSVTAWQVMALRAAKNVGCDIPPETIEKAVGYVKNCYDPSTGGYRYVRGGPATVPCTGAGILSLELCGKEYHRSAESLNATGYIIDQITGRKNQGFRPGGQFGGLSQHFFYGVYYTSQAMFQIGGETWTWYRKYLHALLLGPDGHPQRAGGFWTGVSGDDNMAGVNYCTAMAVLALTVEYRFLPIYQRGEEPEEREGK